MAALAPQVSVRPAGGEQNWPMTGPPFDANSTLVSAAGGAAAVTYNAAAGTNYNDATPRKNVVSQVTYGYDADPAAGATLTIKEGSTALFQVPVVKAGMQTITFTPPRAGAVNTAMVVTLSAGGGSILAYLNATVYTEF